LSLQQQLGNQDHNGSLLAPDGVTGAVSANRFSVHENRLESGVCEFDQLLLTDESEGGDMVKASGIDQRPEGLGDVCLVINDGDGVRARARFRRPLLHVRDDREKRF